MTSEAKLIVERLEGLAGRRGGPARKRPARGRDLLLRLADQAPSGGPGEAARLLHAVLSSVTRVAISESFAARLLERLQPKLAAARPERLAGAVRDHLCAVGGGEARS